MFTQERSLINAKYVAKDFPSISILGLIYELIQARSLMFAHILTATKGLHSHQISQPTKRLTNTKKTDRET